MMRFALVLVGVAGVIADSSVPNRLLRPSLAMETPLPDCWYGVLRLDAITYTNVDRWNTENCHLIGQPGTLIKGGSIVFSNDPALGGTKLGGTLRFQNVSVGGRINVADGADVGFNDSNYGGIHFIVNASTVSWTGGSIWFSLSFSVVGSKATFTGTAFSTNNGQFSIDSSIVAMNGVSLKMGLQPALYHSRHCPSISNSTLILEGSSLSCKEPEEAWYIQNSVLKLTQSTLMLVHETCDSRHACSGNLEIVNSAVDATCAGGHVIQTYSGGASKVSVSVTNSTMHFNNCSCQNDQGLTVAGPISTSGALTIKGSSLDFGECTSAQSVAQPGVMLV